MRYCSVLLLAWAVLAGAAAGQDQADNVMEQPASDQQVRQLLSAYPEQGYFLFPEDRLRPIRMLDALPAVWLERHGLDRPCFEGEAQPGEYYTFQIGFFAARQAIEDVTVVFGDLTSEAGPVIIGAKRFTCFNLGGVDWTGRCFSKKVSLAQGAVQALWIGVDLGPETPAGVYRGTVTVSGENEAPTVVEVTLRVAGPVLADRGDGDLAKHARLRWLNSTIALDEQVTKPYVPLELDGKAIRCLGRQVAIGQTGLPMGIKSFFTANVDRLSEQGRDLLAGPVQLVLETQAGQTLTWESAGVDFTEHTDATVRWVAKNRAGGVHLECRGMMQFDGFMAYQMLLTADEELAVKDIRLEIPLKKEAATYLMGMGRKGGYRPSEFEWQWDQSKHQDAVWVGSVNAGLQLTLKGPDYQRPLVNTYYKYKPLRLPAGWHNAGQGGCRLTEHTPDTALLSAYSGRRSLRPGESLAFDFDLLVTPLKTTKLAAHVHQRYFHTADELSTSTWVDQTQSAGANIINIHQGSPLNPYINYPFCAETVKNLKAFIRDAHEHSLRAKIYYTVRELTNHVVELWALRSLGDEVLASGRGNAETNAVNPQGSDPWLQKHLKTGYIPAWRHVFQAPSLKGQTDAAILTSGMSRWHNYYVEGLDWLTRNLEIDGIYVDDVAYDRTVMQRARKILDRNRPDALVDLHSWNHFNDRAGWASCANLYMENFPYIDSIWFGEGFNYNESPDYWLVEISGIPFGLLGEMLDGGGNPYRGLLYAMTCRLPWSGNPGPIWKLYDDFGIDQAQMTGYWSPQCPVRTSEPAVLATVYRRPDRSLVALASWAPQTVEVTLQIDWQQLGLEPQHAQLRLPAVHNLQEEAACSVGDPLTIKPAAGCFIIIE